jgi:hypothetical protein
MGDSGVLRQNGSGNQDQYQPNRRLLIRCVFSRIVAVGQPGRAP